MPRRRILRIRTQRGIARRLVKRRMRRRHNRRAACHGLEDRDPEPLESRGIREDVGAAVQPRELVVADVAEPAFEQRLLAPAGRARDDERLDAGIAQHAEVLARLDRRHGQDVRAAEIGAVAPLGEHLRRRRMRDRGMLDTEQLARLTCSVVRVADVHVGASTLGLCAVKPLRVTRRPLGEAQRHKVVDGRCAHARALWWVHPVGEVKDVKTAEPAFSRRMPEPRPRRAPAVCERQHRQPAFDVDPCERFLEAAFDTHRHRREGNDVGVVLHETAQLSEQVRADTTAAVGERRDVDCDAHQRAAS